MGSAYNRVIETRKELTKQLLAEMEQGELPWMKGWKTTGTRPYNPVTKAVYKGNNRLRLMLASHFGQFQDNRWVTFNQAKDKGWKIKSGEKGTLCEKWIFEEKKVIEDPVTGEKETVYEELEHPKVNYFILFNADQVDGIPEKEKKEPLSRDEQLALADQFVKSSVCSVIEGANETEAYYSPARDEIHLPARDYFYSAGEFLGTAIHEMGHSTGHPSRLARDISGGFGSTSYAKEELVAELSAVFVQADLGVQIGSKQFTNHAAYLQNWMSLLKDNPNVLFQASADAAKASDFLMAQYGAYLENTKNVKQTVEPLKAQGDLTPKEEKRSPEAQNRTFGGILSVRTVQAEYLIAMKLRSGRLYKNDRSDIAGILAEHEKRGEPITMDRITQAVTNLYGGWEQISASSQLFIQQIMQNGEYQKTYGAIRQEEQDNKELLISFESKYPGATTSENVERIITDFKKKQKRNQTLNWLKNQKQENAQDIEADDELDQ